MSLTIDAICSVTERLGVDCSCFSINDYHFAARSVAEKQLWLRAISNLKVKLRHAMTHGLNILKQLKNAETV